MQLKTFYVTNEQKGLLEMVTAKEIIGVKGPETQQNGFRGFKGDNSSLEQRSVGTFCCGR